MTIARRIQGFFKQSKNGKVFQCDSYQRKWVKEGSQIQPMNESDEPIGEVFSVAAVGSEFKAGKEKLVYLYLSEIVKHAAAPTAKPAYQDEDMAQFEAEQIRELGRIGELPGA